ncbi:MAG: hypothetical protein Kow0083_12890 [Methylophaga sp.]|jgi:membrane fusion protein, heavy metal efflux system
MYQKKMFEKRWINFSLSGGLSILSALLLITAASPVIAQNEHEHADKQTEQHESEADHKHDSASGTATHKEDESDSVDQHQHDEQTHNATESHSEHASPATANEDEHGHGHESEEENHVEIDDEIARQQGLAIAKALAGEVSLTTKLYGRIVLSPDQVSQVRARFPGRITRVNVNFGDEVKKGQLLASVESNNSLQSYNLRAPISGTITAKEASTGEIATDQVLFTITDTNSLWAELKVFPEQAAAIKAGQKVHLLNGERKFESSIKQLLPSNQAQPYRIARVPIENAEETLFPGLLVEAQVIIQQETVDIRIPNSAIQRYEGSQVAFLKTDGKYQVRPLKLGISDGRYSEVLSGLRQGDEIVVENSYLIKADLEKEGAAHAH